MLTHSPLGRGRVHHGIAIAKKGYKLKMGATGWARHKAPLAGEAVRAPGTRPGRPVSAAIVLPHPGGPPVSAARQAGTGIVC